MKLVEKIKDFPKKPGVYLFKGKDDEVIYVGKAKNLFVRIKSYFRKDKDNRPQIEFLIKRARAIDFIVTDTEKEALLLENTLIKKYRPRYNFELKDDKTYASIKISVNHESPGISLTRRVLKDGARYFGPYDSSYAAREALDHISRFFKVRTCSDRDYANRVRACLKYDIGRCTAPCVKKVSKEEYAKQVDDAVMFLTGRSRELIEKLKEKMKQASAQTNYEDAARFRDAIEMLRGLVEKQEVVKYKDISSDAIGIVTNDIGRAICLLKTRRGLLTDKKVYFSKTAISDEKKAIEDFILQYYSKASDIPSRISIPIDIESVSVVKEFIADRKKEPVSLSVAKKGPAKRLVDLAKTNALEALKRKERSKDDISTVESISKKLGLAEIAERIECIDISNIQGLDAVGSIVSFFDGAPDKKNYRIYNIRTLKTPDDYAMMLEVLKRRFSENKIDRPLPDLLLVDGGKGQLAIALKAAAEIGVELPIVSIAKGDKRDVPDRIFVPGRKNHINFKKGSKELLFFMKIRDEAHRFGIKAHRKRHQKSVVSSPLDKIEGVGPKKRRALIEHFKSVDAIRRAGLDELCDVSGITLMIAKKIKKFL